MGEPGSAVQGGNAPPPFAWEDPALRQPLPVPLQAFFASASPVVVVPIDVRDKIAARYPLDAGVLARFGELLGRWKFAGMSPKGEQRLEFYGRLDAIWVTAVVQHDVSASVAVLATLHRIHARKVASRVRRGYLLGRDGE